MIHLLYCPFTGLGIFSGFRGNAWLRERIKIFKQFVVPSLHAQTSQNFTLWVSWRKEEKSNYLVKELYTYLCNEFPNRVVFTYAGVCFWDDKYPDEIAHQRLSLSLHQSMTELFPFVGNEEEVIMTIQPSDDCYYSGMVEEVQKILKDTQACGYTKGYITNYGTKEVREYNPETNPPFFSIKFNKDVFVDPHKHIKYTGPYKSHEYVPDFLEYKRIDKRGFLVGTHGHNISTHFNIPYAGDKTEIQGFPSFELAKPAKIRYTLRKRLMRHLPHRVQRKLRYWFGELLLNKLLW